VHVVNFVVASFSSSW